MSKVCAKCEKSVYPTEELKCLDKVWHKGCFKCWECGMTLNMKNYKGYDKKPYCSAHYPTTKFTAVADTPENQRLAQNSKIQSQAEYHKDFDNSKYTFVADSTDQERLRKNSQLNSNIEYKGLRKEHNDMEARRPIGSDHVMLESSGQRRVGSIADYDPMNNNFGSIGSREWQETIPEPSRQPTKPPAGAIGVLPIPSGARGPQRQSSQPEPAQPPVQPVNVMPPQQVLPQQPPQQQSQLSHQHSTPQQVQPQQPVVPSERRNPLAGAVFQAMYDYVAADKDEVSFNENDAIIDVEQIDEGWMFGTVRRTGLRGMLPSNYIERVQ